MFDQSAIVLFQHAPSLDEIEAVLGDFHVAGRTEANTDPEQQHWAYEGEALVLTLQDNTGTAIIVDVVNHSWVDWPEPKDDEKLFSAFAAGAFGPAVTPGCMNRTVKQTWIWPGAKDVANKHKAMVRIRTTRMMASDEQLEQEPLDPKVELRIVTAIAIQVMTLDGALAYFNPNGEAMRDPETVAESLEWHEDEGLLPLELWSNVRIGLIETGAKWLVMDTVGMVQLKLPDVECCFEDGKYNRQEVDTFLRNVCQYLFDMGGDMIREGDTMEGPGGKTWDVLVFENPIANPMRKTIRFLPQDGTERPTLVLEREPRDREPMLGAPKMPSLEDFMPEANNKEVDIVEEINKEIREKADAEAAAKAAAEAKEKGEN